MAIGGVTPPDLGDEVLNKKEFDEYMCEKYPKLFRDRNAPITESCMSWGFDIQVGWHKLLDDLCNKLQAIQEITKIEIVAAQVKEKFGMLRFYYDTRVSEECEEDWMRTWCDIIFDLVCSAENNSAYICEMCGERGETRGGGWISTLCDECNEKSLKNTL